MSSDDNEEQLKRLTVRELRQRAVKSLGAKVAAGLKAKEELVGALKSRASKAVATVKKAAAKAAKVAPKAKPKTAATAKKAAPAPKKAAAAPAPKKKAAPPKRAAPAKAAKAAAKTPPAPKPSAKRANGSEPVAQFYELPITRDFFVDPRRAALPASYGDDRLLCFRREPLAVVISWDLSAATFADGLGLALELVTAKGRLVGSVSIDAPTGLATFDHLPEGVVLSAQVVRSGRVLARAKPFMLGAPKEGEGAQHGEAWQMTVPPDGPLSDAEKERWENAPEGARAAGGRAPSSQVARRASSSRL